MVKIQLGARSLILQGSSWSAYDDKGRPWPQGERFAQDVLRGEGFFSQEPDLELARANRFVQKAGGRIAEHIPATRLAPLSPGVFY